jgi:hypothetical protein
MPYRSRRSFPSSQALIIATAACLTAFSQLSNPRACGGIHRKKEENGKRRSELSWNGLEMHVVVVINISTPEYEKLSPFW